MMLLQFLKLYGDEPIRERLVIYVAIGHAFQIFLDLFFFGHWGTSNVK